MEQSGCCLEDDNEIMNEIHRTDIFAVKNNCSSKSWVLWVIQSINYKYSLYLYHPATNPIQITPPYSNLVTNGHTNHLKLKPTDGIALLQTHHTKIKNGAKSLHPLGFMWACDAPLGSWCRSSLGAQQIYYHRRQVPGL
jgi:hypothetical protein